VFPSFIPSAECTIPDLYGKNQYVGAAPTAFPDWALNPQPINSIQATEFYSSYINTNQTSFTTVKFDLVHYTGTVKIQAAENYEAVWTDVSEARQYLDDTVSDYFNIVGFHPLLRLAMNNSIGYGASGTANVVDGVVTGISLTNLGQFYVAAPYVQILGNGAGAEAVATVNPGGTVSSINVTNGGSGYLPLQFQGSLAATVVFSNGLIHNVQYR
jgi:hypothetical protein